MPRARAILGCLLVVTGPACVRSWTQTVTVGPMFADHGHTAVVITVEVAAIAHEPFTKQTYEDGEDHGPTRYIGAAGAAGAGIFVGKSLGLNELATAGIDYLPYLYETGTMVGFGGHVGVAAGGHSGVFVAAPRLWFTVPVSTLADAPLTAGLMLRCQIGLPDADGCGPSLVVARFVP